jgi:serine/threonine protein kinase
MSRCEEKGVVLLVRLDGKSECLSRPELLAKIASEYDYLATILVKNFPEYQLYREVELTNGKFLQPLEGTVEEYLFKVITSPEFGQTLLGKGAYSEVFQYGNIPVAVKVLKKEDLLVAVQEYNLMKLVNNSCCLLPYDFTISTLAPRIYLPKMKMDLVTFMRESYNSARQFKILFQSLSIAVYLMHSRGVIHRDLKPPNIMLTERKQIKLTDFGISTYGPFMRHKQNFHVCTFPYRPLEVYLKNSYCANADVFSLGVIALESYRNQRLQIEGSEITQEYLKQRYPRVFDSDELVLLLETVYEIRTIEQLEKVDLEKDTLYPPLNGPEKNDPELCELLRMMLCSNPKVRLNSSEVAGHPYFNEGVKKNLPFSLEYIYTRAPIHLLPEARNSLSVNEKYNLLRENKQGPLTSLLGLAFLNRCSTSFLGKKIAERYEACLLLALLQLDIENYLPSLVMQRSNEAIEVARELNYDLSWLSPILYFRDNPTSECYQKLIAYQLNPIQPYHPYQVAEYLAQMYSLELVTKLKVEFEFNSKEFEESIRGFERTEEVATFFTTKQFFFHNFCAVE